MQDDSIASGADVQTLVDAAIAARAQAYAPYSQFAVGAAVRTADGQIFLGANVENASYGLSMCAERIAIFAAVSAGARDLRDIAVAGPPGVACSPCGACRQVIAEFLAVVGRVTFPSATDLVTVVAADLLPFAFRLP